MTLSCIFHVKQDQVSARIGQHVNASKCMCCLFVMFYYIWLQLSARDVLLQLVTVVMFSYSCALLLRLFSNSSLPALSCQGVFQGCQYLEEIGHCIVRRINVFFLSVKPWKQLRCWRCFPSLRSSKPCQRWGQDPQRFQPGCSSWRARTPP